MSSSPIIISLLRSRFSILFESTNPYFIRERSIFLIYFIFFYFVLTTLLQSLSVYFATICLAVQSLSTLNYQFTYSNLYFY